jgi:hypothetical protein
MQSNPSKTWLTSLLCLVLPAAALGQGRTWMVELGSDPAAAPTTGPTTLQLAPGECKTIAVWVEDPAGQSGLLRNYDIIMPWFAGGGSSGAVEYQDTHPGCQSHSVYTDRTNPDWVFALVPAFFGTYVEVPGQYFGAVQNYAAIAGIDLSSADVPHPGGPNYVAEFGYCAAPDACGTFEVNFILPPGPPASLYQTPGSGDWPVTWQPLHITVGDPLDCPAGPAPAAEVRRRRAEPAGLHVAEFSAGSPATAMGPDLSRSFMVEFGTDPEDAPTIGPTSVQMTAGTMIDIAVYAVLVQPNFNTYQLIFPWFASGGDSGTVSYVDINPGMPAGGLSVFIDKAHPDWAFQGLPAATMLPVSYYEGPSSPPILVFGAFYAYVPGTGVCCGGPNYVGQFSLAASPDAVGVFELPFNISPMPPPYSAFFNICGGLLPATFQPLEITVVPCLDSHESCADADGDGLRDDSCTWWQCDAGACAGTAVPFADIGGANGACPPDGVVDGNDHFHALNCFSNIDTMGLSSYPCEDSPPLATNADAGGPFGQCCPDGVCDGNDAFHTRHGFAGDSPCECPANFVCPCPVPTSGNCVGNKLQLCTSDDDCGGGTCNLALCPPGPQPDAPPGGEWPRVAGRSAVRLAPHRSTAAPGDLIDVDVFLEDALGDLRGYQMHVAAAGGKRGTLELVDVAIHERRDHVFAGLTDWRAFNARTGQMLAGLDTPGIATHPGAYLATFTFKVSDDAAGTFSVELLHDDRDPAQRTFIFPTAPGAKIEVAAASAAVITVEEPARPRASRPSNR